MDEKFKCEVCGNEDISFTYFLNNKRYCRKCLRFQNTDILQDDYIVEENSKLFLNYNLTKEQVEISNELIKNYNNNINSFVHAVCGAGKTEITLKIIEKCLKENKKVGFCVPRKDVVIELYTRLKPNFKNNKCISIYGGHTDDLKANLIILTTHQLYRFNNFFDLLILDEADAFPFKNNEVLQYIFKKSIKGNYIVISATYEKNAFFLKECKKINLYKRFHGYKLPIPKIILKIGIFKLLKLVKLTKEKVKNKIPLIIFVSTIDKSYYLYKFLSIFIKNGFYINSKCENRQEIISKFRKSEYKFLVSTMVLERGVTIPKLQVIVYEANSKIFDKNTLIQISGRSGRKIDDPYGEIIYLASKETSSMKASINELINLNKMAGFVNE